MKLRKTLAGILGAVVMLLGVGTFEHINRETGVKAADGKYVKVTNDLEDLTGDYLIVCEEKNVCFNGGLATLDSSSNNKAVKINNGEIEANSTVNPFKFTIKKSGTNYTIQSASGFYIGQTSNANGLKSSKSTSYSHTISFNTDNSVNLISGGAYLRYNAASDQLRFRYYKSSSYSGQKAIHLYRFEGSILEECQHPSYEQKVKENNENRVSEATCTEPAKYYLVCSDCGVLGTETFTYGEALGHEYDELGYCPKCNKFNEEYTIAQRAQLLLNKYNTLEENETGKYNRHTVININDITIAEATNYFHEKVNMLERTTYFTKDALWMENEVGTYSYYGTKGVDLTGGRVAKVGDTVDTIALKNVGGMEGHYTTLSDIKNNAVNADWTYDNGVYSTNNSNIIKLFLDFTAPCFLNFDAKTANYITLDHVSIEEEGNKLILKLYIDSTDSYKLTGEANTVLSVATISKYSVSSNDVLKSPATITFDNTEKRTEYNTSVQVWEENGVKVTNTKGTSTNNVGDYANPVRMYKNSIVEIVCNEGKFTTLTISSAKNTSDKPYFDWLVDSIGNVSGATITTSETNVIITFTDPQSTFSFVATAGQIRINSITCK